MAPWHFEPSQALHVVAARRSCVPTIGGSSLDRLSLGSGGRKKNMHDDLGTPSLHCSLATWRRQLESQTVGSVSTRRSPTSCPPASGSRAAAGLTGIERRGVPRRGGGLSAPSLSIAVLCTNYRVGPGKILSRLPDGLPGRSRLGRFLLVAWRAH